MQRGLGRGGGEATPSNGAPALVAHKLPFAAVSRSDSITCVLSHPLADALANRDSAQQQLALASCLSILPPLHKMFAFSQRMAATARTSARVSP